MGGINYLVYCLAASILIISCSKILFLVVIIKVWSVCSDWSAATI